MFFSITIESMGKLMVTRCQVYEIEESGGEVIDVKSNSINMNNWFVVYIIKIERGKNIYDAARSKNGKQAYIIKKN